MGNEDPREPDVSEAAQVLIRHLALADRFRFFLALGEPASARALLQVLDSQEKRRHEPLLLDPYEVEGGRLPAVDQETLDRAVLAPLASLEETTRPGVLTIVDASQATTMDVDAWELLFRRLNQARNTITRRLGGPLLLVLNPVLYPRFVRAAPDLFSIRSTVIQLEKGLDTDRPAPGRLDAWIPLGPDRRRALEHLLVRLFTETELRLFIERLAHGRELQLALPARGVSLRDLAREAVAALERRGLIDEALFWELERARPSRSGDILSVAAMLPLLRAASIAPSRHIQNAALTAAMSGERPAATSPASSPKARADWGPTSHPGDPHEAVIVLTSYAPDEVLPGRIHELRLYLPAEADDRTEWEPLVSHHFLALRNHLAASNCRRVLLHPRCIAALAIRVGSIFHRASGFAVACTQLDESVGEHRIWALDGPVGEAEVEVEVRADPEPEEIHLVVSASWDIRPQWGLWRFEHPGQVVQVNIRPAQGPSRQSIHGDTDARAWARAIWRQVQAQREHHPRLPLRIATSCPNGLAIALGRELNAAGQVVLMDFDKRHERYIESFRFQA